MKNPARLACLGVLILIAGVARAGNVLVVDASGGGAYTQIQPAVDAAADGDVILVKSGSYATFLVDGKALAIVGDAGANVQVAGGIQVINITAAQTFLLENVAATGIASTDPLATSGFAVSQSPGRVRLQGCTLKGKFQDPSSAYCELCDSGVRASATGDLALIRCSLLGGQRFYGRHGLSLGGVNATVYDSDVSGGRGSDLCDYAAKGGGACIADRSILSAFGSTFQGGRGGDSSVGSLLACPYQGDGGFGVSLANASSASVLTTFTFGGSGGIEQPLTSCFNGPGCGEHGLAGAGRLGGPFTDLFGPGRRMTAPSPVRESTNVNLEFVGRPGDQVRLFITTNTVAQYTPAWLGTALVDFNNHPQQARLGIVGGDGLLQGSVELGDLGPGVQSQVFYIQPVFTDTQGNQRLGTPSCMVVLDSAF